MAKDFATEIMDILVDSVNTTVKTGLVEAQVMSQGTASLSVLASEDHPYAKRHGFPLRNPAIINEQTGKFLRDWRKKDATVSASKIEGSVENRNRVADYLTQPKGSPRSKMFIRPIDLVIEAKMTATLEEELEKGFNALNNKDIYL